jgi:SPP1 gp7 family putative phage head morphogenesis protein
MNQLERQFAKRLDEIEKDFLTRYQQYLDRVIYLPHVYDVKQVATLQLPLQGTLAKLLIDHAHEVFAIGQAHGDLLCRAAHKKYAPFKLANWQPSFQLATFGYDVENFWLSPEAALKSLEARAVLLAGDVEADILTGVKKTLLDHLHGATRSDTEASLAKLLNGNVDRAKLITTTETTYAYNRGRLSSFHANGVDYVQFSAVMDVKTSAQCRSRHGKIMRLDSPDLANNIPPLHGRCRSVLTPLFSQYQSNLITPDSTNWKNVAPLPKSWRMDSVKVFKAWLKEKLIGC